MYQSADMDMYMMMRQLSYSLKSLGLLSKQLTLSSSQIKSLSWHAKTVWSAQTQKSLTLFYSVSSIFEVFRNLVWEILFQKSGSAQSDFFSGSRKVFCF